MNNTLSASDSSIHVSTHACGRMKGMESYPEPATGAEVNGPKQTHLGIDERHFHPSMFNNILSHNSSHPTATVLLLCTRSSQYKSNHYLARHGRHTSNKPRSSREQRGQTNRCPTTASTHFGDGRVRLSSKQILVYIPIARLLLVLSVDLACSSIERSISLSKSSIGNSI